MPIVLIYKILLNFGYSNRSYCITVYYPNMYLKPRFKISRDLTSKIFSSQLLVRSLDEFLTEISEKSENVPRLFQKKKRALSLQRSLYTWYIYLLVLIYTRVLLYDRTIRIRLHTG